LCSVLSGSTPVPDGKIGAGCPGAYTTESERANEAGEVDGGIGTESEGTDRFVKSSAYSYAASTQVDVGVVVDGVLCCNEEGATGGILEGLGAA
jgi:hypothetical protein